MKKAIIPTRIKTPPTTIRAIAHPGKLIPPSLGSAMDYERPMVELVYVKIETYLLMNTFPRIILTP